MKTLTSITLAAALLSLASMASAGSDTAPATPPIPTETKAKVLATIESYVQNDQELKGAFLVVHPVTKQALVLTLDHVHDGVKPAADGYLACVDFKDAAGVIHDVDIVVTKDASGVSEVFLHKVDGKPVPKAAGR